MPFIGEISALTAALLWAATSLIYASVSTKIGSVQVNVNRMLFSIGWFVPALLILRIPLSVSRSQLLFLVLSSIVGIVFGDTFLFKAFQQMGARISMLIMSLAPAIGAILAYVFLQEMLSGWAVVGIGITLCGIALVVLERTPATPHNVKVTRTGVLYALFGALGQGGGAVLAKKAFAEAPISGFLASFIRIGAALVIMLPVTAMTGHYANPIKVFGRNKKLLVSLLIGSFIGTFLGITLSLIAVAHTKVGIASTLIATSPVLMLPIVRVVHKEILSWKAVAGAVAAVLGVGMLFWT
jgi:drug/metabolite transporter (DMT)-like permease